MLARGGLTLGRPWALSYLYQQAFAFFIFNDVLVLFVRLWRLCAWRISRLLDLVPGRGGVGFLGT